MKILIIIAHPDDEVIMCGGTIAKLINKNDEVNVTYYTQNEEAYFNKETQRERSMRAKKEALKCSKALNFKTNFLGFKDMHIEENKAIAIKATIKEIRRVKPDIIITHTENDKHIDHRTVGEIVPEANFQSGCKLCGGDETWSAKAVLHGEINLEMTSIFEFEIVSSFSKECLQKKIEAFSYYESVMSEHGTESNWLQNKLNFCAQLRGKSVKAHFGEAFIIDKYSPLDAKALSLITNFIKE